MTGQLTAQINTSDSSNSQSCGFGFAASATTAIDSSELFTGRPQVKLVGPRRAALAVELIVGLRDRGRLKQAFRRRAFLRNHAVENDMGDVNDFRPQLASHGLRQRPQRKFRRGKGSESRSAANRSGRA